jgi:signal transduction histidine kinase
MRATKSPDNLYCNINKDTEEQFSQTGLLYCQAIENAGGVPFQLIFGQQVGEGYYLMVGSGIKELLGIPPDKFSEKVFHEMIVEIITLSEEIPSDLSESRKKFISGGIKNYKAEIQIRMPGGEKKWIHDSSLPLIDEETGRVIGAYGIFFDIDEHKQIVRQLEKTKIEAEESERLKNAFLRNISHEIRTPLNAIVGFSTLLIEPENVPGKRQDFIDIIFRSTDHLLEILNDIVEIANIEANTVKIRKEEINLNSKLRRAYDQFRIKAGEKNISLCFAEELDDSEANMLTDGYKLTQILTSLIDNAMKFTEKGEVEFGYSITGNKIKFFVSDTGIGIPQEHNHLIFSRFYQADSSCTRRFEGTGLGLSISKAYIELLGGEIWFTSQPGKGSVFYFTLPYEKVEG